MTVEAGVVPRPGGDVGDLDVARSVTRIGRGFRVRANRNRFHRDVLLMGNGLRHGEVEPGRKAAAEDCGIVSYPAPRATSCCAGGAGGMAKIQLRRGSSRSSARDRVSGSAAKQSLSRPSPASPKARPGASPTPSVSISSCAKRRLSVMPSTAKKA